MPQQPTPQQFGQPYAQQPQPYPPQPPVQLNPFDAPLDRSQRAPSAFEQRFQEYVVATASPAETKRPRKTWPIIVLVIFLVLAAGGAGAYYWYANRMTPEKRFTTALENHLQVRTIGQDYELKTSQYGMDASATIHSVMDISDIKKPKVTGDYTLTGYDSAPREVKFALADPSTAYISYTKLTAPAEKMPTLGSWYQYNPSNRLTGAVVEPIEVAQMIPKATGEIIVGSFTADQRQKIMKQITDHSPYTIVSSKDEGSQMHYVISYDITQLNALNKLVAGMDGEDSSQDLVGSNQPSQVDIWVDKSSNQFAKYTAAKDKESETVTINYPTNTTVTMPKPDHAQAELFKALFGVVPDDSTFAN
jgi:hypothetical protein